MINDCEIVHDWIVDLRFYVFLFVKQNVEKMSLKFEA
jgi:hypothetical protein